MCPPPREVLLTVLTWRWHKNTSISKTGNAQTHSYCWEGISLSLNCQGLRESPVQATDSELPPDNSNDSLRDLFFFFLKKFWSGQVVLFKHTPIPRATEAQQNDTENLSLLYTFLLFSIKVIYLIKIK